MGRRDYRHREPKKQKKDAKKIPPITIISPPVQVEVVKKGKKKREEAEKEE
ncbi:MAG: hypothetical protein ACE5KP_00960 [Dehalococcoidales bacterium]